jgi:ABC-type nitrate/sulfonate/bicarbonate transport system permease component
MESNQMNDAVKTNFTQRVLHILYVVLPFLGLAMLYFGWLAISTSRSDLFPTPEKVYERLIMLFDKPVRGINLFGHTWASLRRVLIALGSALIIGISLGLAIAWSKTVKATVGTLFEIFRPIPPIAWIPLITIWFGIGEFSKIVIVFIGCFVPLVINTYTGITMVESIYVDVGRVFNASRRQMFFEISLPSALSTIFAGFRAATGGGWLCVLAAEMLGAKEGLGFLITRGMEAGDMALIFVAMLFIGITGAILAYLTFYLERWICPWKQKQ